MKSARPFGRNARLQRPQHGLTLVELLVAMVIGLVVTLAVTSTITIGEAHKRTTTSNNDMGQTGAYSASVIDRALRSAGSAFTQAWSAGGVFGCKLGADRSNAAILPRTDADGALKAPFAAFLGGLSGQKDLRVSPVLIGKDQSKSGSDVLMIMGSNGAAGDVARPNVGNAGGDQLTLNTTIGLLKNDLVLVSQSGKADCRLEQVSAASTFDDNYTDRLGHEFGRGSLPLGGTYHNASNTTALLSVADGSGYLSALGKPDNIQFLLFGVGDNQTLYSYDLLRTGGTDTPQPVAEGVYGLYARYGLDTNLDGKLDTWAKPDDTGWDIATVMKTPATARQIVAVRVALVMRSSLYEKTSSTNVKVSESDGSYVAPSKLTLFETLDATFQQEVTVTDRHYRHRVVEFTVPLRNMLLLPTT